MVLLYHFILPLSRKILPETAVDIGPMPYKFVKHLHDDCWRDANDYDMYAARAMVSSMVSAESDLEVITIGAFAPITAVAILCWV